MDWLARVDAPPMEIASVTLLQPCGEVLDGVDGSCDLYFQGIAQRGLFSCYRSPVQPGQPAGRAHGGSAADALWGFMITNGILFPQLAVMLLCSQGDR